MKFIGICFFIISIHIVVGVSAQDIYAGKYKTVFTAPPKEVPTAKTPDAPLAGNGDIGLTLGGGPQQLTFYLGKNDFWRAYPVYPGGGIALPGGLTVTTHALAGAAYHAEQDPGKATISAKFTQPNVQVTLHTWVAATHNAVVAEFSATGNCVLQLHLWAAKGNTAVNDAGQTGNVHWVTRSFMNTPLLEWPAHVAMAMKVLGGELQPNGSVTLTANKKVTVVITMYTNFDRSNWKEDAVKEAESMTTAAVENMRSEHISWWKQFWNRSGVRIGDPYLEKYYFLSQYFLASTVRGNKFPPGIWGCFITQDSSAWGGDYHLNYNYQAPFWAAYSSNYIDLLNSFDDPLLDYMQKGKVHAQALLQVKGIYYPVGIGPKGLVTTRWPLTPEEMQRRYGSTENTIDSGYKFLGQKINAVFSVGNMLMRFYSTYDSAYARKVYAYMLECANFWEDYLKWDNGRYVIYMDHFNEIMPNLRNNGQWRDRLGDVNSTLSLGLVKMLFKGIIDVSSFLQKDEQRQQKWLHIVAHLSRFPVGERDGRLSLKNMEKGPQGREVTPAGLNRVSIHGLILPGGVAGPKTDSVFNAILLQDVAHWKTRMRNAGEWGNTLGNGIETCFPGAVRVGYDASEILKQLKDRIAAQSLPNGWIIQSGGGIETLAAVPLTINEMLLQSYEGIVRVFPNWDRTRDASFSTLRAYGAFVVSSRLQHGQVEWVRLFSEKGRTCIMENPWPGKKVQLNRQGKKAETLQGNTFSFPTKPNEMIVLRST
jgi:alpha-L-fucosidase 2